MQICRKTEDNDNPGVLWSDDTPGQKVGCETSEVVRGSTVSEESAFGGMERDQNLFLPSALAGGPQLAKTISVDHQATCIMPTVNLELPGATSKNIKSKLIEPEL